MPSWVYIDLRRTDRTGRSEGRRVGLRQRIAASRHIVFCQQNISIKPVSDHRRSADFPNFVRFSVETSFVFDNVSLRYSICVIVTTAYES
ncbi:hypothetical protein VN97_g621 [Penicillium thymicola]|uniref:Uncharacterized protein n=1 Tax=Penicillium thymicola TaxID=293382 RepID=A0AAI9TTR8_PENTH|nr:hypothetical protein VN97_g621 [Penicillium thymicola]